MNMHVIEFAAVVNFVNILLLLSLVYIYVRNFLSIKATFCIGLMIFVVLFLLENLLSLYFHLMHAHVYSPDAAQFSLVLNLLQTLGFGALVYVTWKP